MDAGTTETLYAASELVRVLQNRQGFRFNVPEEIAYNRGWINKEQLSNLANNYNNTSYGSYLLSLTQIQ
jgi:glucose-1-phosphate thymidylyltransferase